MLQIWFIDKAFEGSNIYTVEDIPDDIDVMVLPTITGIIWIMTW